MLPQPYSEDSKDQGEYSFEKFGYMKVPEPSKNGGLYTGEAFAEGAAYGDVKVIPDAFYMNNVTLASANPPPGAMAQAVHQSRPGNNQQQVNNYKKYRNIYCQPTVKKDTPICAYNHFDSVFDYTNF
jgi:hypothetical protein